MNPMKMIIMVMMLIFSSCNHYYYSHNKANIPGLREKNDMVVDAGIGTGWAMMGAEVQTAYAVGDHFGIMINGSVTQNKEQIAYDWDEEDETKSAFIEAGIGYFKNIEANDNWLFEIYGGGGKGSYWLDFEDNRKLNLKMNRFFAQPSMVYTFPNRKIEFGIASRISVATYSTNDLFQNSGNFSNEIYELVTGPAKAFWEPSFRFSAGPGKVKFYFSFTPSLSLNQDFINREIANLNGGIRFIFNTSRRNGRF